MAGRLLTWLPGKNGTQMRPKPDQRLAGVRWSSPSLWWSQPNDRPSTWDAELKEEELQNAKVQIDSITGSITDSPAPPDTFK